MNKQKKSFLTAGIALLVVVVMFLLTSPNLVFAPMVTFIDTELYRSSGHETPVRTVTDLGSPEYMSTFPREIGKWVGFDFPTTEYLELLGADIIMVRIYEPNTFSQPVFFTIMQGNTESNFHHPKVCVRAQGYIIEDEGEEEVVITNASWAKETPSVTIPLKKLVYTKNAEDGSVIERRVMLLCYVKGNQFYSDVITLIQVEALAPLTGSYEDSLNEEKEFLTEALPLMFEPSDESTWYPFYMALINWGITGYLIIAFMFIIPLAAIIYSRIGQDKN